MKRIRPASYSMAPYLRPTPIEPVLALLVRSQLVRRRVSALPDGPTRRAIVFRFAGWFYRRYNTTDRAPDLILAPDVAVEQASALFDSAGSFTGPGGFGAMLAELREAFEYAHFVPWKVTQLSLSPLALYFDIHFEARGLESGVETERNIGHIVDLDTEMLIRRFRIYWDEREAREAAGLSV